MTDPSPVDTHTYAWSVTKGGQLYQSGTDEGFSFTPDDNGTYVVTLTVTDDDSGEAVDTKTITVTNVAPTVGASGAASVNEGAPYELTLAGVADPGADTVTQYVIRWGDGHSTTLSAAEVAAAGGKVAHTYAEGAAGCTARDIAVDLTDEDGAFVGAGSTTVTVQNVAPVLSGLGATATVENGIATLTATLADAGVEDAGSVLIHWGDGSSQSVSYAAGTVSIAVTHQYLDDDGDDLYTISATATDDGGFTIASTTLNVANVAPQIAER